MQPIVARLLTSLWLLGACGGGSSATSTETNNEKNNKVSASSPELEERESPVTDSDVASPASDPEFEDTEKQLQQALAAARAKAAAGDDGYQVIQALTELANHYRSNKQWEALVRVVEERHALQREAGMIGTGLIYLAGTLAENGQAERALKLLERVDKELTSAGASATGSERETFYSTQTEIYLALDRLDDAIESVRHQIEIAQNYKQYSDYWETQAYLASLLQTRKGDIAAAIVERKILWAYFRGRLQQVDLGYNAIVVHITNGAWLAHAYRQEGETRKAIPIYELMLADLKASPIFGPDAIEVPTVMIDLGECFRDIGDRATARKWADKADAWLQAHEPQGHDLRPRLQAIRAQPTQ